MAAPRKKAVARKPVVRKPAAKKPAAKKKPATRSMQASILGIHIPGTSKKKGVKKPRVAYKPGPGLKARASAQKTLLRELDKTQ